MVRGLRGLRALFWVDYINRGNEPFFSGNKNQTPQNPQNPHAGTTSYPFTT